jgi:uncharacterized membrane protein YecN with MAPEG domain
MSVSLVALMGFAGWTLLLLVGTVGWHRWSRILTGRAQIASFSAEAPEGPAWYRRAMRAHANCVENLPVFGALIAVAALADVRGGAIDAFAVAVVCARVAQSVTHVAFEQTNAVVWFRFGFFFAQLMAMLAIGALTLRAIG